MAKLYNVYYGNGNGQTSYTIDYRGNTSVAPHKKGQLLVMQVTLDGSTDAYSKGLSVTSPSSLKGWTFLDLSPMSTHIQVTLFYKVIEAESEPVHHVVSGLLDEEFTLFLHVFEEVNTVNPVSMYRGFGTGASSVTHSLQPSDFPVPLNEQLLVILVGIHDSIDMNPIVGWSKANNPRDLASSVAFYKQSLVNAGSQVMPTLTLNGTASAYITGIILSISNLQKPNVPNLVQPNGTINSPTIINDWLYRFRWEYTHPSTLPQTKATITIGTDSLGDLYSYVEETDSWYWKDINLSNLSTDTTYYWYLTVEDSNRQTNTSTKAYFRLNRPPNKPYNLSPANNLVIADNLAPTLSWSFYDPDYGQTTQNSFSLEIYKASDGTLIHNTGWVTTANTTYTIPANILTAETSYKFRVKVRDLNLYESIWSDFAFFTLSTTPSPPTPLHPKGTTDLPFSVSATPEFRWTHNSYAGDVQKSFDLVIYKKADNTIVHTTGGIDSTESKYVVPSGILQDDVQYYWKVRSESSKDLVSNWSEVNYFSVYVPKDTSVDFNKTGQWSSRLSTSSVSSVASAVLNGELHLLGGHSISPKNYHRVYKPDLNVWDTSSFAPLPYSTYDLFACGYSNKIYAGGGHNGEGTYYNYFYSYDPVTNMWTRLADLLFAVEDADIVEVAGKLYVIGGANGSYQKYVQCYDPVTNAWTRKADMLTARNSFGVAVIDNRYIHVIGGLNGNAGFLKTHERYDTVTDKWDTRKEMPTARRHLGCAEINRRLYCFGGYNDSLETNINNASLNLNEMYNPDTDSWLRKAPMLEGRDRFAYGVIDDMIYVACGWSDGWYIGTAEKFDPNGSTKTFIPLPQFILPRPDEGKAKDNIDYIRLKVNEFRFYNGLSEFTEWTDPNIVRNVTPIKAEHWNEIQKCIADVYTYHTQGYIAQTVEDRILEIIKQDSPFIAELIARSLDIGRGLTYT